MAKEYIERQKALNVCEMHYQHCLEMHDWSGDTTADNIMRDIETLPTADVVEVVRCKDCKHRGSYSDWDRDTQTSYICYECLLIRKDLGNEGFCSYGERKDENDESN